MREEVTRLKPKVKDLFNSAFQMTPITASDGYRDMLYLYRQNWQFGKVELSGKDWVVELFSVDDTDRYDYQFEQWERLLKKHGYLKGELVLRKKRLDI